MSGEGRCVERGGNGRQFTNTLYSLTSPLTSHSLPATSHIPKQRCSGWDQDGEAGVTGCTPRRAEPGALQSRTVAAGPGWATEFPPRPSTNPQHPKTVASPRKKGLTFLSCPRNIRGQAWGLEKGDRLKYGISRAGPGRSCGCCKHWVPGPAGRAGTYEAAKHGAGDAGGQAHGRGQSGPADMSPEPLRCPPAPGARRIPAAGPARCSRGGLEQARWRRSLLGSARLSPPLLSTMEWAQLRPLARARKGAKPGKRGARDRAGKAEAGWGSAHRPGSSLPAARRGKPGEG